MLFQTHSAPSTPESQTSPPPQSKVVDRYVTTAPSWQNSIDIFKNEWSSKFPAPFSHLEAGTAILFQDARVDWAVARFGGVAGGSILELGPLEGGHTYMLERAGFGSVTSIEANTHAFLRCLIAKEILGMSRTTRFLCGDFVAYLRNQPPKFDAVFACGVLYHMTDPAELISLIAAVTDEAFFWTHYYDPRVLAGDSRFSGPVPASHLGFSYSAFRQQYGSALGWGGFCGGSRPHSYWMTHDDILACLRHFGFSEIETGFEHRDHPNGPSFALLAKKARQ